MAAVRFIFILFSLALSLPLQGCGSSHEYGAALEASSTACKPGVAEILVADTFIQILCGCVGAGETAGRIYLSPDGLTCQLPSSSTIVFFFFLGNRTFHQIIPTESNAFPPSPLFDPDRNDYRSFAIVFPRPATSYGFIDVYSAGVKGTIIVP